MYFSECKDFQAQNMSQIQHSSDALFHIAVTNKQGTSYFLYFTTLLTETHVKECDCKDMNRGCKNNSENFRWQITCLTISNKSFTLLNHWSL